MSEKITIKHLQRKAVLYIRQSGPRSLSIPVAPSAPASCIAAADLLCGERPGKERLIQRTVW
jgi:hypothetical protein